MTAALSLSCASAPVGRVQEPDETQLRLVRAELRMVGRDSTWVAPGTGYELVAWSKADIVLLQFELEEQARVFRRVFNAEPQRVVVSARRLSARPGAMPTKSPPVPGEGESAGALIDVTFVPPGDGRNSGAARRESGFPAPDSLLRAPRGPGETLMAAWLEALSRRMVTADGKPGRIPTWVEDAIPRLVDHDNVEDLFAVQLAAHPESLAPVSAVLDGSCGASGGPGAAARPAPQPRPRDLRALRDGPPLEGSAKCAAEALLIARYLMSREGYALLGRMAAAQIAGGSTAEGLVGAVTVPRELTQLDGEWRRWLQGRADQAGPRER